MRYNGKTYGLEGVVDVGDAFAGEGYDDDAGSVLGSTLGSAFYGVGSFRRTPKRDVRGLTVEQLAPSERVRTRRGERSTETLRERLRRERDEVESAILILAGQLTRRQNQLEHLERYPEEDPFTDGTKLEFEKTFPGSEQRYAYLALRAAGRWHLTGQRSPQNVTWEHLVEFMGLGVDEVFTLGPRGGRKKVIG